MKRWPRSRITRAEARQLRLRHAVQAVALGFEVHGEEDGDVVQDRRNDRPHRDLEVGHREELGHHERGGAHHRRHDLAAGRGGRFDRGGEVRAEAAALHERDRHRPVDHHVRHRAARHRAEQARAHDRDLARARPRCGRSATARSP